MDTFTKKTRTFIKRMIRIRKAMIRMRVSRKEYWRVTANLDYIDRHVSMLSFNDQTMARFILRHQHRIRDIIPANSKKDLTQFDDLVIQAMAIANHALCEL
jgi:hypothetical protein